VMHPFWKTKTGRLFIGGCGTQIGLMFSLTGLAVILMFCALCTLVNVVSLNLTQDTVAQSPFSGPARAPSPPPEVDLLREQVNYLVARVQYLRDNPPVIPVPTATPIPPPPKPVAVAGQSAVNLRSGPGVSYSRIGRLALGESLEIVGRNNDSSWWLVATPGGGVAWLSAMVVAAANVDDRIPVVSIPALLVQPGSGGGVAAPASFPSTLPSTGPAIDSPTPAPLMVLPPGTPTPAANVSRRFVQDTMGYKQLVRRMMLPTVSESFSPQGDQIAITERIKLSTIPPDGTSSRTLLEDNDRIDLIGGAVWSPDGRYLAFIADQIGGCQPCRIVGLVRTSDGSISYLPPPPESGLDRPRWTQDGRLLVTAFRQQLTDGRVFVYDTSGQGQLAEGVYVLSSSHDGQKWFPWLPGRIWQVNEGVDDYYRD
jgi:hypothetical protein